MKTTNKNRFFYLLSFSGRYKYLSILGCILSAVAAIMCHDAILLYMEIC